MDDELKPSPWVEDPWFYGTWEGSQVLQLERAQKMTFLEKLRWNEEAWETVQLIARAGEEMRRREQAAHGAGENGPSETVEAPRS